MERVGRFGDAVELAARVRRRTAVCPGCGPVSARVHGRYTRRLVDGPVAGARVVINLVVRRFRCEQDACGAVTFVEQVAGVDQPARPVHSLTQVVQSRWAADRGQLPMLDNSF